MKYNFISKFNASFRRSESSTYRCCSSSSSRSSCGTDGRAGNSSGSSRRSGSINQWSVVDVAALLVPAAKTSAVPTDTA